MIILNMLEGEGGVESEGREGERDALMDVLREGMGEMWC